MDQTGEFAASSLIVRQAALVNMRKRKRTDRKNDPPIRFRGQPI